MHRHISSEPRGIELHEFEPKVIEPESSTIASSEKATSTLSYKLTTQKKQT
jgi:hypothetical protein